MAFDVLTFFLNGKYPKVPFHPFKNYNLYGGILGKLIELLNPDLDLTLVQYLRETLGLCGTKIACGSGGCGSCTVTLAQNDYQGKTVYRAINACLTKLWTLHGASITTVEGLGSPKPDEIHPIQERIYKAHGSQCGFCTPGMVIIQAPEDYKMDCYKLLSILLGYVNVF
jgi:xanthine dehydrogenase iron-sulfur cluster and FAD-binding subunit A